MIRIKNFSVPFDAEESLELLAARRLRLPPQSVTGVVIVRKAMDARRYRGAPIQLVYMLDVELSGLAVEKKLLQRMQRDKNLELVKKEPAPLPKQYSMPAGKDGFPKIAAEAFFATSRYVISCSCSP